MKQCLPNIAWLLAGALPCVALAQPRPPGPLGSGWSLDALEGQCTVDGLAFDQQCLSAVKIDLGVEPAVESVRRPDGSGSEQTRYFKPEVERATALMDRACKHGHWQTCTFYLNQMQAGKLAIPGRAYDMKSLQTYHGELLQWMCAEHHAPACAVLERQHVAPKRPLVHPADAHLQLHPERSPLPPHLPENAKSK